MVNTDGDMLDRDTGNAHYARMRALVSAGRIAGRMVLRRSLRSALAALGVAIIVAGLVVAETVAEGGRRNAIREIERIGADVLTVNPAPPRVRGGRERAAAVTTLLDRDARELQHVDGVALVAGEFRGTAPVKVGALARQASIAGADVSYGALRDAPLAAGRFFDEHDAMAARRVAVIGARLADDLAGGRDAVHTVIRVRSVPFVVVGVLAARGFGLEAFDEDETVFVPLTTARERLFEERYLSRIYVRVRNPEQLARVSRNIAAVLGARRVFTKADQRDFVLATQDRLVQTRQATIRQMEFFQVAIAIVLTGIGAAGVFGLQLLSVRERRAEIGIRRALGGTRGDLFLQFTVESLLVTTAGAIGGAFIATLYWRVQHASAAVPITVGAAVSCLVAGALASVPPTRQAAGLPPAVAMRIS